MRSLSLRLGLDFNSRVDIEESTPTQDDLGGEVESPWTAIATSVPCCVQPGAARKRSAEQRQDGRVKMTKVWMRPQAVRLGKSHRLKFGTAYLYVMNAINHQERGQLLLLECEENPE